MHVVPENCPRGHFAIARTQVVKAKVRSQGDAAEGPDKSWLGRGQVRRQDVSSSYQKVKHCQSHNGSKGQVLSQMSMLLTHLKLDTIQLHNLNQTSTSKY